MAQETKTEKAQRLLDDNRVFPIAVEDGSGVYVVRGDTKAYLVTVLLLTPRETAVRLGGEPASCTCEARGLCSHILAADAAFTAHHMGGTAPRA
jgi:hypothetical protein